MAVKRPSANIPSNPLAGGGSRRHAGWPDRLQHAVYRGDGGGLGHPGAAPPSAVRVLYVRRLCGRTAYSPAGNEQRRIGKSVSINGGILNLVDVFSGGALKKETIFAMGIVPYINASIIMQLVDLCHSFLAGDV